MNNTEQHLVGVVIDLCTRSFLLLSSDGEEKIVECETPDQFMRVLSVVNDNVSEDCIEYAEVAVS